MGEESAMVLALQIVGIVYIAAMAVLGGFFREALRKPPSSVDSGRSVSNVIPFRRGTSPSVRAGVRDS
jgi:hypothetical protein